MSTATSIAFLTGITVVGMGAIADDAAALSTTQTQSFEIAGSGLSLFVPFAQFNQSSGNLDSVVLALDSVIAANGNPEGFLEASISTDNAFIASKSGFGIFSPFGVSVTAFPGNSLFSEFLGPDYIEFLFTLSNVNNLSFREAAVCLFCDTWTGTMSVTYNFTPAVSPVPVPAAFPLLASAMAGLGMVARKRKAKKATR